MKTSGEERGVTTVRARRGKKALYNTKNENSEAQGKELRVRVIIKFRIKIQVFPNRLL